MQVRHTARARRDLIDIWLEIAPANPAAAEKLYNRLQARVEILKCFPEAGRLRPDIAPGARVLVESPYVILYRIVPGAFRSCVSCMGHGTLRAPFSSKESNDPGAPSTRTVFLGTVC